MNMTASLRLYIYFQIPSCFRALICRDRIPGHGTCTKQFLPKRVDSLLKIGPVSTVACGLGHTLVLMASGLVYSWGHGTNGRLGLGNIQDRPTATLVAFGDDRVCKVRKPFIA